MDLLAGFIVGAITMYFCKDKVVAFIIKITTKK